MGIHDMGYKRLFSRKNNFLKFLETFVKKDWVNLINPNSIELIDKEFIVHDFSEKESDIIYKMEIDGEDVYFYLLIELQSSVDFSMPLRFLTYTTELMKRIYLSEDEKIRKHKNFKLPCVVPVLLYTGKDSWTCVRNFKDYQISSKLFKDNIIDFSYILVNINDFSDEELIRNADLISMIFSFDKKIDINGIKRTILVAKSLLQKLNEQESLDFKQYLRDVFQEKYKNKKNLTEILEIVEDMIVSLDEINNDERTDNAMTYLLDKIENDGIRKEKISTVKNCLKNDLSILLISRITGLSEEEILKIKDELKNQSGEEKN